MVDYQQFSVCGVEELLGKKIKCGCGKTHSIETRAIHMGKGSISHLSKELDEILPVGKLLVVSAEDIFETITKDVISDIQSDDREIEVHLYPKKFTPTIERASELFCFDESVRAVLSVGSGCVTDVTKYFAKERDIPFIAVATAPSMDGYISSTSVILMNGIKQSLGTKSPEVLIADYDIMKLAPREMIAAGFGDVASKYMAIFDWFVAKEFTKEFYCPYIAKMVIAAAEQASVAGKEIVAGVEEGYAHLVEALLRSSVAMQLLGQTRCASGAEHNTAHVLDMIERHKGLKEHLHGEEVFLMYSRLVQIYKLFYENETADTGLLPDMDERMGLLISETGITEDIAEKLTTNAISPSAYSYLKKTLKENREVLFESASDMYDRTADQIATFIALYEDENGKWLETFDQNLIKKAIVLSTEIKPKFVTLNVMKYLGLLENYLF